MIAPITASTTVVPRRAAPAFAEIALYTDLAAAEPLWRRIEAAPDSVLTPYQRFDLLAAWQRHVGSRNGITPLIAVCLDAAGAPLCLWPLGRRAVGGAAQAEFLGGKHANFNSPIWRREVAARIAPPDLQAVLRRLGEAADALVLLNQPQSWDGLANPLALLPHGASADPAYHGALMADFDALLAARMSANKRKKLRNRERALTQHGAVTLRRAGSPQEVRAFLTAFHAQKAERMRELGVDDVFAEPGVADFIAEAACGEHPVIEVYALYAGDVIAATTAGIVAGSRFSTMFNSIIRNELAQASPGQLLLTRLIETLCGRGLQMFDLGVGEAHYKEIFCNEAEPLFDSFLALSPAGRLLAGANRALYAAKRTVKRTPALWNAVQTARRWRSRVQAR